MSNQPINIYVLVLPRVHLLDLAAPAQVFAHPSLESRLRVHYISPSSAACSQQGLQLAQLDPLPDSVGDRDWLMLVGTGQTEVHRGERETRTAVGWLQQYGNRFGLVAGICSGALLAARAGLLAGRRCTTHHDLTDQLRRLAPDALVQEDCIFTNDGNLWTSAGITTGLDLCLQLVANQWGQQTAVTIARELVLYQRRSGHEPQLSFWLKHRNHIQSRVHQIQDLVMTQPGYPWSVLELSERACVSERHLRRLFLAATGINLQDYLQQARLELARQLLEQTRLSLPDIAQRCGFQAERSLRRTWARWLPETPARYRRMMAQGPV